jgi:hypothetical protein
MTEGPEERAIQRYEEEDFPLAADLTESYKVIVEASKHLTTLNAGSVVVIGTFLSNIFPTEQGTLAVGPLIKGLIASSFVCFGVSLILATLIMIFFARAIIIMAERAWLEPRYRKKELQWDAYNHVLRLTPSVPVDTYDVYSGPFYRKAFVRLKWFVNYKVRPRMSLLPLPFFTLGLLCFGTAVVLNLYR